MLLSCYYQITSTILYHEQLDFIDKHYGNTNHNLYNYLIPGIKNSARSSSTHPRGNLIIIKYFCMFLVHSLSAPAIALEHDLAAMNTTSTSSWTMYKQCDSQWANDRLGTCSLTVCQAGN